MKKLRELHKRIFRKRIYFSDFVKEVNKMVEDRYGENKINVSVDIVSWKHTHNSEIENNK